MRKLFIIPIVLLAVFSTACSADLTEKPNIEEGFTCEIDIAYGEDNYCAEIHRIGQGVWEANLTEPKTVSGMSMHYENGEVSVRYKGFNVSLPDSSVPMKAVTAKIFEVLDNIANNPEATCKKADSGAVVVEGNLNDARYIVTFGSDGKLASLNIPSQKMSVSVK